LTYHIQRRRPKFECIERYRQRWNEDETRRQHFEYVCNFFNTTKYVGKQTVNTYKQLPTVWILSNTFVKLEFALINTLAMYPIQPITFDNLPLTLKTTSHVSPSHLGTLYVGNTSHKVTLYVGTLGLNTSWDYLIFCNIQDNWISSSIYFENV